MLDDIVGNKCRTIERCMQRIQEEYAGNPDNLKHNITRQDSIVLNIQRVCEAAIDLGMHLVSQKGWGLPQTSKEVFDILCEHHVVDKELATSLKKMIGFRNIAVHDYQALNLDIVQSVVEKKLNDIIKYCEAVIAYQG